MSNRVQIVAMSRSGVVLGLHQDKYMFVDPDMDGMSWIDAFAWANKLPVQEWDFVDNVPAVIALYNQYKRQWQERAAHWYVAELARVEAITCQLEGKLLHQAWAGLPTDGAYQKFQVQQRLADLHEKQANARDNWLAMHSELVNY